jgi:hypothetical protein
MSESEVSSTALALTHAPHAQGARALPALEEYLPTTERLIDILKLSPHPESELKVQRLPLPVRPVVL